MTNNTETIWTPANIVTFIRILLIPVFVAALLSPWPSWLPEPHFWAAWQPWIAAGIFAVISATDAIDGYLARHRNEITDFGKFLDPLADKILVCAALLALVELNTFPSWVALIIIAREFIVSGLRMIAAAQGKVIAASGFGKVKTILQIAAILLFTVKDSLQITVLGDGFAMGFTIFSWVVLVAAVIMTIVSLIDYFIHSKEVLGLGKGFDHDE